MPSRSAEGPRPLPDEEARADMSAHVLVPDGGQAGAPMGASASEGALEIAARVDPAGAIVLELTLPGGDAGAPARTMLATADGQRVVIPAATSDAVWIIRPRIVRGPDDLRAILDEKTSAHRAHAGAH